jgi:antitoxin CptB
MSEPEHASLDIRRKRLLYRATHRGTHENDLLIGGFVGARIAALTDTDLDALEEVLEFPDVELANWLTGRKPIPPEADSPMLRRIKESAQEIAGR